MICCNEHGLLKRVLSPEISVPMLYNQPYTHEVMLELVCDMGP